MLQAASGTGPCALQHKGSAPEQEHHASPSAAAWTGHHDPPTTSVAAAAAAGVPPAGGVSPAAGVPPAHAELLHPAAATAAALAGPGTVPAAGGVPAARDAGWPTEAQRPGPCGSAACDYAEAGVPTSAADADARLPSGGAAPTGALRGEEEPWRAGEPAEAEAEVPTGAGHGQDRLASDAAVALGDTGGVASAAPPWSDLIGHVVARTLKPLSSSGKTVYLGTFARLHPVLGATRACVALVVLDGERQPGPAAAAGICVDKAGCVTVCSSALARAVGGHLWLGWRWRRRPTGVAEDLLEVELVVRSVPRDAVAAAVPAVTDWSDLLGQAQHPRKPMVGALNFYLNALVGHEALLGPAFVTLMLDGVPLCAPLAVRLRADTGRLSFSCTAAAAVARGHTKQGWRWRRAFGGQLDVEYWLQSTQSGSGAMGAAMDALPASAALMSIGALASLGGGGAGAGDGGGACGYGGNVEGGSCPDAAEVEEQLACSDSGNEAEPMDVEDTVTAAFCGPGGASATPAHSLGATAAGWGELLETSAPCDGGPASAGTCVIQAASTAGTRRGLGGAGGAGGGVDQATAGQARPAPGGVAAAAGLVAAGRVPEAANNASVSGPAAATNSTAAIAVADVPAVTDWSALLGQAPGHRKPLAGSINTYLCQAAGLEALLGPAVVTVLVDGVAAGAPLAVRLRADAGRLSFGSTSAGRLSRGHLKEGWRWRWAAGGRLEVELMLQSTPQGSGPMDAAAGAAPTAGAVGVSSSAAEGAEAEGVAAPHTVGPTGHADDPMDAEEATAPAAAAGPGSAVALAHAAAAVPGHGPGAADTGWSELLGQPRNGIARRALPGADRVHLGSAADFVGVPCTVIVTVIADGAAVGGPATGALARHNEFTLTLDCSALAQHVQGRVRLGWCWRRGDDGVLEVRLHLETPAVASNYCWSRSAAPVAPGHNAVAAAAGCGVAAAAACHASAVSGRGAAAVVSRGAVAAAAADGAAAVSTCHSAAAAAGHATVAAAAPAAAATTGHPAAVAGGGGRSRKAAAADAPMDISAALACPASGSKVVTGGAVNTVEGAQQPWVEVACKASKKPLLCQGSVHLSTQQSGVPCSTARARVYIRLDGPRLATAPGAPLTASFQHRSTGECSLNNADVAALANGRLRQGWRWRHAADRVLEVELSLRSLPSDAQDLVSGGSVRSRYLQGGISDLRPLFAGATSDGSSSKWSDLLGKPTSAAWTGNHLALSTHWSLAGRQDSVDVRIHFTLDGVPLPGPPTLALCRSRPSGESYLLGDLRRMVGGRLRQGWRWRHGADGVLEILLELQELGTGGAGSGAASLRGPGLEVPAPHTFSAAQGHQPRQEAATAAAAANRSGTAGLEGRPLSGGAPALTPAKRARPQGDEPGNGPPPTRVKTASNPPLVPALGSLGDSQPCTSQPPAPTRASVIAALCRPASDLAAAAAATPAACVEEHLAMWADIVGLLERSAAGLLAGFDRVFDAFWRRRCNVRRDVLAEQWRPQYALMGRGNVARALALLHTLMPGLELPPAAATSGAQQGAGQQGVVPPVEAGPLVRAAHALLSRHVAVALLEEVPQELRRPKHIAMWEEVVSVLLEEGACAAAGRPAAQLDWAAECFWWQRSGGQRDVLVGQWRPVCESLGMGDVGALLRVVRALLPGLVL